MFSLVLARVVFIVRLFILCFFVSLCSFTAHAQDYKSEIADAEVLGRMIYENDVAGWVATDDLLADEDYIEIIKPNLKGWVSLKEDKGYKTIFIGDYDGAPKVVFEVISRKHKIKDRHKMPQGRSLSKEELLRWTARRTIVNEKFEHCPQFTPMNTIVLPVPNDIKNRLYGYLFSASKDSTDIVFGKHYRFTLSSDATTVLDKRDFSKSCISVKKPRSQNAVGAVISHIMQPYPEEHHIFANLSHGVDIYVLTPENSKAWKLNKGKVSKFKLD